MKTILVVDDERNIVDLLRLYLEKEGFAVLSAADGEEALALHRRHEPDLVVLDLMLPRIDGFEVCRQIRRQSDVPIIMVTLLDDMDCLANAFVAGATDYITKPLNRVELLARVRSALPGGGSPLG